MPKPIPKLNYQGVVNIVYDMGAGWHQPQVLSDDHIRATLDTIPDKSYFSDYGIDRKALKQELATNSAALFQHVRDTINTMPRHP